MRTSRDPRIRHQIEKFEGFDWTLDDPRYRKVAAFLEGQASGRLLDLGCGNGAFAESLSMRNWRCVGMELLANLVRETSRRGIQVVQADAAHPFPVAREQFDVVFAGEILEHQVGDDDFLEECHRVVRPGGLLILTTPNLVSLGNRILMSFGKLPRYAYFEFHYRIYTLDLLLAKIRHAGFGPIHTWSSHVIISRSSPRRFLARWAGGLGEWLGAVVPRFGEMFVVVSRK
jgi:SAM-dependent methyltransferase